jgi:competence protein ComEA
MKKILNGCLVLIFSASLWAAEPLLNINNATQTELEMLKGIGPVLAERIIQYREKNGTFSDVFQLSEISGISGTWVKKHQESIKLSDSGF